MLFHLGAVGRGREREGGSTAGSRCALSLWFARGNKKETLFGSHSKLISFKPSSSSSSSSSSPLLSLCLSLPVHKVDCYVLPTGPLSFEIQSRVAAVPAVLRVTKPNLGWHPLGNSLCPTYTGWCPLRIAVRGGTPLMVNPAKPIPGGGPLLLSTHWAPKSRSRVTPPRKQTNALQSQLTYNRPAINNYPELTRLAAVSKQTPEPLFFC